MGFRADGTLWGISAKTSLFINPEAWSAQQGEEGVLEGKELGLEINEHTKEPLPFRQAGATGARWLCGKVETHFQTHVPFAGQCLPTESTVIVLPFPILYFSTFFFPLFTRNLFFFLPPQSLEGKELLICKSSDL